LAYNLFIAYDLREPGQNYDAVTSAIKELGAWHHFQYSLFYVSTQSDPWQSYHHVIRVMDANDRLAVINAQGGVVSSWDRPPINEINAIWSAP
jgi:hypothetical protein